MPRALRAEPALAASEIDHEVIEQRGPRPDDAYLPLVLAHGLDSGLPTWDPIVEGLTQRGVPVVRYNARGSGGTPARGDFLTPETQAGDLLALIDGLGLRRANLLGHSLGARTCLQFSAMHPDRVGCVVFEDMEFVRRGRARTEEATLERAAQLREAEPPPGAAWALPDLERVLERMYGAEDERARVEGNPKVRARGGAYELSFTPHVNPLWSYFANCLDLHDEVAAAAAAGVPMLLVRAEPGQSAVTERGARLFLQAAGPAGRVAMVRNAGHSIHGARPQEFLRLVLEFLEAQPRSRADRRIAARRPAFVPARDTPLPAAGPTKSPRRQLPSGSRYGPVPAKGTA
eukprot:tig00001366_g8388.t1